MKSLIDKSTAELFGQIALQEQVIKNLIERVEEQGQEIAEIKSQLSRAVNPSQLVSEAEAAKLLNVSQQTLARWRKSARPVIPFVREMGLIRYSLADIDNFIRKGTRGFKLRAA